VHAASNLSVRAVLLIDGLYQHNILFRGIVEALEVCEELV
jgi:hypothetical protein